MITLKILGLALLGSAGVLLAQDPPPAPEEKLPDARLRRMPVPLESAQRRLMDETVQAAKDFLVEIEADNAASELEIKIAHVQVRSAEGRFPAHR